MEENRIKQKKSLKEWIVEDLRKDLRMWRGTIIGFLIGYVISGVIQSDIPLSWYLQEIFDVLIGRWSGETACMAWIFTLSGAVAGSVVEKILIRKGKIKG